MDLPTCRLHSSSTWAIVLASTRSCHGSGASPARRHDLRRVVPQCGHARSHSARSSGVRPGGMSGVAVASAIRRTAWATSAGSYSLSKKSAKWLSNCGGQLSKDHLQRRLVGLVLQPEQLVDPLLGLHLVADGRGVVGEDRFVEGEGVGPVVLPAAGQVGQHGLARVVK